MPEARPQPRKQLLALILFISALILFAVAMLFFTGVIPLPEETRLIASIAIGLAAAGDLFIAILFFRQGQSS
jgi:hypothetical protein